MARVAFKLSKGGNEMSWGCDGSLKLDKLRDALKADPDMSEFLSEGDRFVVAGAALVKSREAETAVEDALAGKKELVIQSGDGGTEEENVRITLDFGSGTKVQRTFNVKMFLHDLRKELETLEPAMAAEDRFMADTSEIPDEEEEKKTSVESVLKNKVLTIKRAPVASGSVRGKISLGKDNQVSYTFKPEMLLSDLRKELAGKEPPLKMADDDRFLDDAGATIPKSQESDPESKVAIALKNSVLTIKKKEAAASPVTLGKGGKGEGPKIEPIKAPTTTLTYTNNTSAAAALAQLKEDTQAATTSNMEYYYKLADTARQELLISKLQIRNGLVFRPSGFTQADEEVLDLNKLPGLHTPADVLDSKKEMTFSETVHELRKKGVETAGGSAGFAGIGLSAKYTKETETLSMTKKTKMHLWASQEMPKVELFLKRSDLKPTSAFVTAVRNAVAPSGEIKEQHYKELLGVLNDYGFYLATRFWLGGQIYAEQSQEITEQVEASREMESFQVAFEVSLEVTGYPVKAGANYGNLNEEQRREVNVQGQKRISKKAKGGDAAAVNNPATYCQSLAKADSWAVIRYLELVPTPELLPPDLKSRCAQAIDKYYLSIETPKQTVLDMKTYALALNKGTSDDFV
jgi:hypothetical protein